MGPVFTGPLFKIYRKLPVYYTINILFIIFSAVAVVSRSIKILITICFLLELKLASIILNLCINTNLFLVEYQGRVLAIIGIIFFIIPVIGLIISGFISEAY